MGNEMVDERVDEIRAQHEEDQKHIDAGDRDLFDWTDTVEIHAHRAYLLAEVKRLREEVGKGAVSAEYLQSWIDAKQAAEKEIERLRSAVGHGTGKAIAAQITAEARLAELVGRLRAELDACDVEEMAYCGGGDGPCGGPAQQPDTVERVRAVLKEYSDE